MELRVLVIDDDKIFNLMTKVILRDLGISPNPQCFVSGKEALSTIDQNDGTEVAHLLFLDINMPAMSGWDILDYLGSYPNHRNIHVVVVTSSIDRSDKERALSFDRV